MRRTPLQIACALAFGTILVAYPALPQELIPRHRKPATIAPGAPLDIYEAVVRHLITSWNLRAGSYCIEVEGRDAPPALLQRLNSPRVKKASACQQSKGPFSLQSIVDRKTKEKSILFDVSNLRVLDDTHAEVSGGYYCANLCAAEGTYHLERTENGWTVIRFDVLFQS